MPGGRQEQGLTVIAPHDEALLRFLTKHGCLDAAQREAVEKYAQSRGTTALEAVCDGGFATEEHVAEVFRSVLGLSRAGVDTDMPYLSLRRPLDQAIFEQHMVVPVSVSNGRLLLAMANPLDHDVLRQIAFASGLRVVPAVATLGAVRAALLRAAALPEPDDLPQPPPKPEPQVDRAAGMSPHHPIVKLGTLLLERAAALRASDVHLEPTADGITVRYRIDGVLEEATRLAEPARGPLVARLKVMAALDIAERRVPQDGGLALTLGGRRIDCRVSTLPTQYGEKVVVRILDAKRDLVDLAALGIEENELKHVAECLKGAEGMILTTGPTGAGKSTTLYAMLRAIQSSELNIVTVENPIEYRLPGITQTEIRERQGLTFAAALRSILRQDPDVILVGEIRDAETAQIAVQAAQTGHLVLSTLHTNDAVGAVTRLAKLGVDRELIASTLLLVIAQRLVRTICPRCSTPITAEECSHLPWRDALGGALLRRGAGCPECRQTGYRGRVGVYEVFRNTVETQRSISQGGDEIALRELVRRLGGRSLMQAALDKVRCGRTTPNQVALVFKADERYLLCPECGAALDKALDDCTRCGRSLRPTAPQPPPAPASHLPTTAVELSSVKDVASSVVLGAGVRGLCAAGGLDDLAAAELELAVCEACGLARGACPEGLLHIAVECSTDRYRVCVSDVGPAWFWPEPDAEPPGIEKLAEANAPEVQAFLIRSSVDEACYEREGQSNRLWLTKQPTPAPSAAVQAGG